MVSIPGTKDKALFVVLLLLGLVLFSCLDHHSNMEKITVLERAANDRIIRRIQERGKLVAVMDYNSTDYFIYRGTPMGYHYELLKLFTDYLNVGLEIVISDKLENSYLLLVSERCDLIAKSLAVTKVEKERFFFSDPIFQTRQVLVQRKPGNRRNGGEDDYIRNHLELGGRTIHVTQNPAYINRINHLAEETGEEILVVVHEDVGVEGLIAQVASGKIDYTVAEEHIAKVNRSYYPVIDISVPLGLPQNIAWAVKQEAYGLLGEINNWLAEFETTALSQILYRKYFENPRAKEYATSGFFSPTGGKISEYDDIIRKHSEKIGWDWLLVASVVYQESRFDPTAVSWAGAFGLMQLMPGTAYRHGIDTLSSPDEQIWAGTEVLALIEKSLQDKVPEPEERVKFTLASYNAGIAHVYDARRLAEKYSKNPSVWTGHVDSFMIKKSDPVFYNDSVVKYGFCRGEESFNFVLEVLERYSHYKNLMN